VMLPRVHLVPRLCLLFLRCDGGIGARHGLMRLGARCSNDTASTLCLSESLVGIPVSL
jgi:hypothetical protein